MKAALQKHAGFTLVETVVIIGMYALILVALANLFTTFSRLYTYEQSFVATSQAAGDAMLSFANALMPASQVLPSYSFSGGTRASASSTLVLEVPSITSGGAVIANSFDYIAFYASSTELYRLIESAPGSARASGTKLLISRLGSLIFTYDNADFTKMTSVIVDLTASSTIHTVSSVAHRREQFYLRN